MSTGTELIRTILDIIDQLETPAVEVAVVDAGSIDTIPDDVWFDDNDGDVSGCNSYSNSPHERVAPVSAVTTDAGGGLNGPKHPADIRTDAPSMYPNAQWDGK